MSSVNTSAVPDHAKFDPLGILATLDRHRVAYIVVGAFARVVRGAEEITRGIDIVPSSKPDNLDKLEQALRDLDASRSDGRSLASADIMDEPATELATDRGELKIVAEPAGTRGFDDLRRAATREPLGHGLRPAVASLDDLGRMVAALGREDERVKLRALRRLAELERGIALEL
jgi:hypothetical protein